MGAFVMAISVGQVRVLNPNAAQSAHRVMSAIDKQAVSTLDEPHSVQLEHMGFEGDEHADTAVHGGVEKAVYAYPHEHYAFWHRHCKRDLLREAPFKWGAFGENLTIQGLLEQEVWVGDVWQVAQVKLQVVKFREPCFKFNMKMNDKHASKAMLQSARSGWYLRVLETGKMCATSRIEVLPGPREVSIWSQNQSLLERQNAARELF